LSRASYSPSAVTYSRADATGFVAEKTRRRYGAGRSELATWSGVPSWAGGVKLSLTGPRPIQDAAQPAGASSTANVAGPLHADTAPAASQARTCHSYRPPLASGGPA